LVVVAIALAAGIALDRYGWPALAGAGFGASWCVAVCLLVAWWWTWRGGHAAFSAWLLLSAVALTGAAWHELRWNLFPRDDVGRYAGLEAVPACATVTVLTAPEILPAPRPTPLRAKPGGARSRAEVWLTGNRDGTRSSPSSAGRCRR
jgi:hypothetical protein